MVDVDQIPFYFGSVGFSNNYKYAFIKTELVLPHSIYKIYKSH